MELARTVSMLIFVGLVAARWFGFTSPDITEAETLALWEIIKIGLGLHIFGLSAEKVFPACAKMLKKE